MRGSGRQRDVLGFDDVVHLLRFWQKSGRTKCIEHVQVSMVCVGFAWELAALALRVCCLCSGWPEPPEPRSAFDANDGTSSCFSRPHLAPKGCHGLDMVPVLRWLHRAGHCSGGKKPVGRPAEPEFWVGGGGRSLPESNQDFPKRSKCRAHQVVIYLFWRNVVSGTVEN